MKTIRPMLAACLFGCALIAGCASETKTTTNATPTTAPSPGAVNSKCPVAGEPIDGKTMVSFQGQNVGFCCAGCASKWNGMTDAQKQAKLTAATTTK